MTATPNPGETTPPPLPLAEAAAPPAQTAAATAAAARSVSAIAFNQVAQVAGSVLFVVLVPRTLGPVVYGQLAFAFALITILQMCGELGYQEIFSRFLPEVRLRQGEAGVRAMVRGLFAFRALAGLGLGLAAVVVARLVAPWLAWEQAGLIGLSVLARVWAMGPFPLLLGLGETLKWSVETTWRQIVVTVLVLAIVRTPSLTLGLVAMTAHEVVFLLLGAWWVRGWIRGRKSEVRGQTAPHDPEEHSNLTSDLRSPTSVPISTASLLKFGFTFSLANLALVIMFRISPIMVEVLTGSHPETGYFDLALGGLLLVYTLLGQVAYAFVPILTQLHLDENAAEADVWLGRVVRYSTLLVTLGMGGMWAVATPAAPLLFGADFGPAAGTLRMMAFGLLPLPLAWAGVTLTAVEKRPRRKLWAALLGLGVFLVGAWLLRGYASAGIALAFAAALLGYALGFGRSVAHAMRAGAGGWGLAFAGTLIFVPLFFLRTDSLLVALGVWALAAGLYLAIMLMSRVASLDELRPIARALRR